MNPVEVLDLFQIFAGEIFLVFEDGGDLFPEPFFYLWMLEYMEDHHGEGRGCGVSPCGDESDQLVNEIFVTEFDGFLLGEV